MSFIYFKKIVVITFCLIFLFILSFFFLLDLRRVSARKAHVGALNYKADCAVFLMRGGGKLKKGFSLLNQGGVRKLIISGVDSESEEDLEYLLLQKSFYKNLKEKKIILDSLSESTYESAKQTKGLVQKIQCKNLILITSHLHMYRAYRVFSKLFPEDYLMHTIAVEPRSSRFSPDHYVTETFKSLYYSLWAY